MTDHHVAVQMDNLTERQRDRSRSRDRSLGPRKRIPRAVSEVDEENDDGPDILGPSPGVDDGLLSNDDKNKTNGPKFPANGSVTPSGGGGIEGEADENEDELPKRRPSITPSIYNGPRTILVDGIETQVPDLNAYQHKKTLAQGMMDLALLSANANQLRYVLESYNRHPYFYPSLIFISLSIIFQVAVGVGLILNSQYNVKDDREICKANRISNLTIIGIFIITVVNVFISAFGVADAPADNK
ncbi:ninjurin-A-like [Eupeodes corollae]|uniref:ninjurin-A-like n=1 Tax=Eupeodes corollae TaxID=290404 RepID=UPI00248F7B6A|nr:ninjurin-A-like [Eupeodes corollae]